MCGVVVLLVGCRSAGPLAECAGQVGPAFRDAEYPEGFVLTWRVTGPTRTDEPLDLPAVYILDADGRLRVSVGPISRDPRFPPTVAHLAPHEIETLWHTLQSAGLTQPLNADSEPEQAAALHELRVGTHRRWVNARFTLASHPDAAEPLDALQRFAGISR